MFETGIQEDICSVRDFVNSAIESLKTEGGRVTKQRKLIIETLSQFSSYFSATDVFDRVSESHSVNVDLATVYRVLGVLQEFGLLHHIPGSQNYLICKHTACTHDIHVIFSCSICDSSSESSLPARLANTLNGYLAKGGFTSNSSVLQVTGVCANCGAH